MKESVTHCPLMVWPTPFATVGTGVPFRIEKVVTVESAAFERTNDVKSNLRGLWIIFKVLKIGYFIS